MSSSSPYRAFQPYPHRNYTDRSDQTQSIPLILNDSQTANSSDASFSLARPNIVGCPSPIDITIKPSPSLPKRRSSTISISNLLPRRKSLQTTALATRRQSLWMSIAKNGSGNEEIMPPLILPSEDNASLIRKKILRILLVISYLLSISILAIALATFYGFFWSGYSSQETTRTSDNRSTSQLSESSTLNTSLNDQEAESDYA